MVRWMSAAVTKGTISVFAVGCSGAPADTAETADPGAPSVTSEASYAVLEELDICLLYTSPSPRDATLSRMPSSA